MARNLRALDLATGVGAAYTDRPVLGGDVLSHAIDRLHV